MKCEKCGRYMDLECTYYCRFCKVRVDVDNGVALWKVLSDAREKG